MKKHHCIFAIILSARSGAGKGTVSKQLLALSAQHGGMTIKISVSDTTRPKKEFEQDGVDYNFISIEEFQRRKDAGYYIETDLYAGNWYGSPRNQFEENKAAGIVTLYDVEVHGAETIQAYIGTGNCKIFMLNVPLEELQKRADGRDRDTEKEKMDRREADNARFEKMVAISIPIEYGPGRLPEVAANEIYDAVFSQMEV